MNDLPLNLTIIAAKAKAFVAAKEHSKDLEKRRNASLEKCENYERGGGHGDLYTPPVGEHCWQLPRDPDGNMTRFEEFCEPCKESCRLHREWVKARQLEAGKLRSLVRFVKESKNV